MTSHFTDALLSLVELAVQALTIPDQHQHASIKRPRENVWAGVHPAPPVLQGTETKAVVTNVVYRKSTGARTLRYSSACPAPLYPKP